MINEQNTATRELPKLRAKLADLEASLSTCAPQEVEARSIKIAGIKGALTFLEDRARQEEAADLRVQLQAAKDRALSFSPPVDAAADAAQAAKIELSYKEQELQHNRFSERHQKAYITAWVNFTNANFKWQNLAEEAGQAGLRVQALERQLANLEPKKPARRVMALDDDEGGP